MQAYLLVSSTKVTGFIILCNLHFLNKQGCIFRKVLLAQFCMWMLYCFVFVVEPIRFAESDIFCFLFLLLKCFAILCNFQQKPKLNSIHKWLYIFRFKWQVPQNVSQHCETSNFIELKDWNSYGSWYNVINNFLNYLINNQVDFYEMQEGLDSISTMSFFIRAMASRLK